MKQRPILFSAPMVRALLDGSKTQTRRIITPQPQAVSENKIIDWEGDAKVLAQLLKQSGKECPYGQVGDQLWVRETWRTDDSLDSKAPSTFASWPVKYEADGKVLTHGAFHGNTKGKTRTSIHMPRWASRITLEITGVRVERLQDISEEDAMSEGAIGGHGAIPNYQYAATPVEHFKHIWESINGAESWEANPWVWVLEFKRVEQ
ncbi:hypothetical protein [Undibacterium baiyunense]|uniref:ASCH domain-containing protein n=1 Tax=Undibacterium baiyunense TaxID=2828731 RepID=A0A941DH18_9BURK|nr:hypothetical protein [Undibacterium baiyunense]MBR7747420.1 hypothetical protein [Undibacterium baiyunense]